MNENSAYYQNSKTEGRFFSINSKPKFSDRFQTNNKSLTARVKLGNDLF